MSLATRCVSCGTVFRVVQDQLKVSEGWVRCGRCDEVFSALEHLFDLDRDAPPARTPPDAPTSDEPKGASASDDVRASAPEDVILLGKDDRVRSRFFQPEQDNVAYSPAEQVDERDRVEFADARFNDELLHAAETTVPDPLLESLSARQPSKKARWWTRLTWLPRSRKRAAPLDTPEIEALSELDEATAPHADEASAEEPEFLRRAKAHARWNTPAMRMAFAGGAVALGGLLGAQVALHHRDVVAARWPATLGPLTSACEWFGCQIEAPRRIEAVTVDSSALAPARGGTAYRLSLLLRNRGSLPVATPSIDLTLTDSSGQLIARRALSPADFPGAPAVIPADAEAPLQLLLASNGPQLSSYIVEVFYP